jgi:hypothetical protein
MLTSLRPFVLDPTSALAESLGMPLKLIQLLSEDPTQYHSRHLHRRYPRQ